VRNDMAELHSLLLLKPHRAHRKLANALAAVETTEHGTFQPAVWLETRHHAFDVAKVERGRISDKESIDRKPLFEGGRRHRYDLVNRVLEHAHRLPIQECERVLDAVLVIFRVDLERAVAQV